MFPDFVHETIESEIESFCTSCANCEYIVMTEYARGGEICCEKVRHPLKEVPFDIIRMCVGNMDTKTVSQRNFTPDEALEVASNLTTLVNEWMIKTSAYKGFRDHLKEGG